MAGIPAVNSDDFYLSAALIYCVKAGLDPNQQIGFVTDVPHPRSTAGVPVLRRQDVVATELRDFDNKLAALLDARR
jgi:hypothetical protein